MNLKVIKMGITNLMSIVSILSFSQTTTFGQCNPMPKADFSAEDICETDSVTFVNLSQNAETYLWKFGDGNISTKFSPKYLYNPKNLHNGLVTLVARHSNGCADSITKQIIINANPSSDFSFTINQNEVNFTAKQFGSTSYSWYFSNGDSLSTSKVTYTYSKSVKDTVCLKVINAAGCSSKTCKEVIVALDIIKTLNLNGFKIYPNPNSGNFTVDISKFAGETQIEIINQFGQSIHKEEIIQTIKLKVNIPNGVYLIKVTNNKISQSGILIIENQ